MAFLGHAFLSKSDEGGTSRLLKATFPFAIFLCLATSSFSRSIAGDRRVVATRGLSGGWAVEYQVLVKPDERYIPCFQARVGRETWITGTGLARSGFTIYENGGWSCRTQAGEERYILWDRNGDALFDVNSGGIRFGNQLIETEQVLAQPWKHSVEVGSGRSFRFIKDRFVVSSDQSVAAGHCYSFPKPNALKADLVPDSDAMKRKLKTLQWQKPDFWVPSEREYVEIPFKESSSMGAADKIVFRTMHGIPIEVSLKGTNVAKWIYGDTYSQEFHFGKNANAHCSKIVVGPLEYTDDNGDGKFDAFYNSDANELVEMRPSVLVRGNLSDRRNRDGYRFGWLLYPGIVIVAGLFCHHLYRRSKRWAGPENPTQTTDNGD